MGAQSTVDRRHQAVKNGCQLNRRPAGCGHVIRGPGGLQHASVDRSRSTGDSITALTFVLSCAKIAAKDWELSIHYLSSVFFIPARKSNHSWFTNRIIRFLAGDTQPERNPLRLFSWLKAILFCIFPSVECTAGGTLFDFYGWIPGGGRDERRVSPPSGGHGGLCLRRL